MNPYAFVPMANGPQRQKVEHDHSRLTGLSGRLVCRLTARTPLFVPRYRQGTAARSHGHEVLEMHRNPQGIPLIPGTSLKGVIRTVAEAAANGCFTLPSRFSYDRNRVRYSLPRYWKTCQESARLCPTCRLFGMLNRGSVFAGNVSVQDAVAEEGFQTKRMTLAVLSAPKPRHKPFYSKDSKKPEPPIRGRKFYYHYHGDGKDYPKKDGQNKTVEAVLQGATFTFEVDYVNLTGDDLNLLLFALTLWEDTCHKVGMGKPIGLGSAKIEIVSLLRLNREERYRCLGGGSAETLRGKALADFIASCVAGYRSSPDKNLQELHRILRWDETLNSKVAYPDWKWFKDNPDTPLEGAP